jgi:hypothetical protein
LARFDDHQRYRADHALGVASVGSADPRLYQAGLIGSAFTIGHGPDPAGLFDHRVIDGARLMAAFGKLLEKPMELVA